MALYTNTATLEKHPSFCDIQSAKSNTLKYWTPTTILCEPAQSECTWICQKSTSMRELQEMPRPKIGTTILFEPAQRKCMWTCRKSRFTREFTGKMLRPKTGSRFCASLRSRNALGHVRPAILCENSHGKCRAARSRKTRGAEFVRAYAIEMHMGMWPRTRIYRTKTGTQMEHPDQATALTLTARALQCGHIDWGNLREKTRPRPGQPFGASLRGRNAFGLRRAIFCDILLQTGTAVFVRDCAVGMHLYIWEEPFDARIYRKNAEDQGDRFVRVCAVEMHMDMSQDLRAKI